jgi:hypothetical protein
MADDVRETLSAGFRNEKHKAQWKSTLETYAAPLHAKPVDTIAPDGVRTKPENQPHALGYAPGETLWSKNPEREAVPIAGHGKR